MDPRVPDSPGLSRSARVMAKLPAPMRPPLRRLIRVRSPRPSFGPGRDLEGSDATTSSVMVACEARTGSQLLCQALEDSGSVGAPDEIFTMGWIAQAVKPLGVPVPTAGARRRRWLRRLALNPRWYIYDDYEPETFAAYVEEAIRRRTGPNGVFSAKLHWSMVTDVFDRFGFDITTFPGPITWIHLTRDDLVAQAVSLAIARQTGAFARRPEGASALKPARYDDDLVLDCFESARRAIEGWEGFFAAHDIDPIRVSYEELATDYEPTIRSVLDALGFPDGAVPPAGLRRQADATNAEWAARFRAAHPDLDESGTRPG